MGMCYALFSSCLPGRIAISIITLQSDTTGYSPLCLGTITGLCRDHIRRKYFRES